jgi:hypothetical protein
VVVLGAIAYGLIYLSLPHHHLPDNFDFHGQTITEARRAGVARSVTRLAAFERRAGIRHIGTSGRSDWCEPGQDNFERSDAYAYSCRLEVVQLFPVRAPVRTEASRLGEALIDGVCPAGTTTDMALAKYHSLEELPDTGGDCTVGNQLAGAPRISGWFPVGASPDRLTQAEFALPPSCDRHTDGGHLCQETPLDLAAASRAAPRGAAYIAIVYADDGYYNVDW